MLGTARMYVVSAVLLTFCALLVAAMPSRRRAGSRRYDDDDYFWLNAAWPCPNMRCRNLTSCVHQEMVLWFNGPHTCRGCPFCLDYPVRGKRSANSWDATANDVCQMVSCPEGLQAVDASCRRSAALDGYVGEEKCRTCSACVEGIHGESFVDNSLNQPQPDSYQLPDGDE